MSWFRREEPPEKTRKDAATVAHVQLQVETAAADLRKSIGHLNEAVAGLERLSKPEQEPSSP